MNPDFILPAGMALHMQRAVAGRGQRAQLSGVHVEPIPDGGAFLVATDGLAMLIHRAPTAFAARAATIRLTEPAQGDLCDDCGAPVRSDPGEARIFIPAEIAAAPVAAPCHHAPPTTPGGAAFYVVAELVDCPFPDWRRALSADASLSGIEVLKPGPRIDYLDPDQLARIYAYWPRQPLANGVRIHQMRPGAPWLITFAGYPDTLALIMPHRCRAPEPPVLDALLSAIGRQDLLQQAGDAA